MPRRLVTSTVPVLDDIGQSIAATAFDGAAGFGSAVTEPDSDPLSEAAAREAPAGAPQSLGTLGALFDFNGDGTSDFLLESTASGTRPAAVWFMQNAQRGPNALIGLIDGNFDLEFVVDVNNDDRADITFSNPTTPQWLTVWQMNGFAVEAVNGFFFPEGINALDGIGDFNADGYADFVSTVGSNVIALTAFGAGYAQTARALYAADLNRWVPFNTGNFDGDSDDDVFWVDVGVLSTDWFAQAGSLGVWTMQNGAPIAQEIFAVRPAGSFPIAGGDFNGDGRDDIVWLNVTGDLNDPDFTLGVWLMNGTTQIGSAILGLVDDNWGFAGIGDFNGDGRDDVMFQQVDGGDRFAVWLTQTGGLSAVIQAVTTDPAPGGNGVWDGFG